MNDQYKTDIVRKLFQFSLVAYFVVGFLKNYAWICVELDFQTRFQDILRFWNPIAITTGLLNIINFLLIIVSLNIRISKSSKPSHSESSILLFSLTIPLFLVTIVYVILRLISFTYKYHTSIDCTFMLMVGELLLFSGTMFLLVNFNFKNKVFDNNLHREFVNFVLVLTAIGIFDYFLFHMISQQINNFVVIASNYSIYSEYYGKHLSDRTNSYIKMDKVNIYLQPLAILYCCVSVIYFTLFVSSKSIVRSRDESVTISNELRNIASTGLGSNSVVISNTPLKSLSIGNLRIPPLSLILGIMFITITLVILVITIPLINSGNYVLQGQLLSTIYPIPIYILSMVLLCIQINEMKRWNRLETDRYKIHKMLIWIGVSGQLMLSFAEIIMNYYKITSPLTVCKIFANVILILQTLIQTIAMSLSLERRWMSPEHRTWQDYICPAVGMLSINLGFLFIALFDSINVKSLVFYTNFQNPFLFLRIFESGFQYFGLTLATFQRLHSSLIFGKMVLYTNR